MFRKILVPVDGSPRSEHALPFALSIARGAGAELHVAMVHVPEAYDGYAHVEDLDADAKARERQYLDALSGRLRAVFSGAIQVHHLEGIVSETLTEEVLERDIDLVVVNAHGWGYISRTLLGSVSDYLMRHLTVPLLLTHTDSDPVNLSHAVAFRRVLISLDGSELAEAILGPVATLGQLYPIEYQLLRVVVAPSHPLPGSDDRRQQLLEAAKTEAASYLKSVADRLGRQSSVAHSHVTLNANVVTAILREANTTDCDLVAISTHGRGGLPRLLFGSVADKVIRSARQAVLVCRGAQ